MQLPMDSYVCGINSSFESILIISYLRYDENTFRAPIYIIPGEIWCAFITRKVNLTKRENFMT